MKINIYKKMQWWTINYFLYQTISEIINTDKRMKISLDCVVHQRTGKNDLILNIDDTSMILIPKLHKLWLFINSVICWKRLTIWIMRGPYLIWLSPFLWFYSWNMPRYSDTHDYVSWIWRDIYFMQYFGSKWSEQLKISFSGKACVWPNSRTV